MTTRISGKRPDNTIGSYPKSAGRLTGSERGMSSLYQGRSVEVGGIGPDGGCAAEVSASRKAVSPPGTAKAGQPTILAPPSSSDPAGDFLLHPGLVSDFAAKGMVTAAVNDRYGKLRATQIEFEPRGKPTGLCVGVATTPAQDEELSLQPCTVPGATVWIIDVPDSSAKGFVPLVNGANADFSQPFTMTYGSDPSHTPREPIRLRHLIKNNGGVPDQQLWSTKTGS